MAETRMSESRETGSRRHGRGDYKRTVVHKQALTINEQPFINSQSQGGPNETFQKESPEASFRSQVRQPASQRAVALVRARRAVARHSRGAGRSLRTVYCTGQEQPNGPERQCSSLAAEVRMKRGGKNSGRRNITRTARKRSKRRLKLYGARRQRKSPSLSSFGDG